MTWKGWLGVVGAFVVAAAIGWLLFELAQVRRQDRMLRAEIELVKERAMAESKRADEAAALAFTNEAKRKVKAEEVRVLQAKFDAAVVQNEKQRRRIAQMPRAQTFEEAEEELDEMRAYVRSLEQTIVTADDTIARQQDLIELSDQTIDALRVALHHRDEQADLFKKAASMERKRSNELKRQVRRERFKRVGAIVLTAVAAGGAGYAAGQFL